MKRPWKFSHFKLLYFQTKIEYTHDLRLCRNFQRLLNRTSFIQLLVLHKLKIDFYQLSSEKYRYFLKSKILHQLWIFSLFPILKRKKNQILNPKNKEILYSVFQTPQYVVRLHNFFNPKNKCWIISNLLIEKKFFLKTENWQNFSNRQFSLKTIFKIWTTLNFHESLVESNDFLIVPFQKFQDFQEFVQIQGCRIQFQKFYCLNLNQGMNFFGWFFLENDSKISLENIKSFKKECQYLLNINQPIDQVFYNLNQKIYNWQKFYNCSLSNDLLFSLIWKWLKKRYRKKTSKWLYNRYWKKSTTKSWIFSTNTIEQKI